MNTEEAIKKLGKLFRGMQVDVDDEKTPIVYVRVAFPQNWIVGEETTEKFNVQYASNGGEIYFYADLETGSDAVFDAIFYNVEQNKEAMEKANLFNEKVNELKQLFSDTTYNVDKLKKLKFVFEEFGQPLPPKFKGKKSIKKEGEGEE